MEPDTCQFWCKVPCTRTATIPAAGWDDVFVCTGHGMLLEWNRETWDYAEDDDISNLLDKYLAIKNWFKSNPRP